MLHGKAQHNASWSNESLTGAVERLRSETGNSILDKPHIHQACEIVRSIVDTLHHNSVEDILSPIYEITSNCPRPFLRKACLVQQAPQWSDIIYKFYPGLRSMMVCNIFWAINRFPSGVT
jgi:hypothetical protein